MAIRFFCLTLAAICFAGCGTMASPVTVPSESSSSALVGDLEGAGRLGAWTLAYTGGCAGRESETLLITQLDETVIVFDEFELLRNETDEYVGSAIFIAPMPVDGRDIPYEISYVLRASDNGRFSGTETITEGGGASLGCPITLTHTGAH